MSATWFVRAGKGHDTIHLAGCKRVTKSLPWLWAEGLPISEIAAGIADNGLRVCKVCKPLGQS